MNRLAAYQLLTSLPREELQQAITCEASRRSLATFVRNAWHHHHEDQPLLWNWHIDCLCDHLVATFNGDITWLIINLPPGFSKSLLCSVYFPAWAWLHRPTWKFLCSSTNDPVTYRDARRHHDLVASHWYRSTFLPDWDLSKGQSAVGNFANTRGGERVSRTVRAGMIGLRPDCRILDDPVDPLRDLTNERLDEINNWLDTVFLKRRARKTTPLILVMQRLHDNDPTAYLVGRKHKPGTVHLVLPNEFEPARKFFTSVIRSTTGEPWEDPRTTEGELLAPMLLDAEMTAGEKEGGEQTYQAQQQQNPTPPGGLIFKRDAFKRWSYDPKPDDPEFPTHPLPKEFDYSIASCDFNNLKTKSPTKDTDYAVIQVWGVKGLDRYLRVEIRRKMGVSVSIQVVVELRDHYPDLACILIEKAANGPTVLASARALLGLAAEEKQPSEHQFIRDWSVQGESKRQRAEGMVNIVDAGRVFIPSEHEDGDMEYWLSEVCGFDSRRRDDRVDCLTSAMTFLERQPFG